jgi:hypothetical protein
MRRPIRGLLRLGVVILIVMAILTSVQVALAHYPIPPGCWETRHTHDCGLCGFLWLLRYDRDTVEWRCPDGSSGLWQYKGLCGMCKY